MPTLLSRLACVILLLATFATTASARPPHHRLPPDYHWGRCLLVVQGQTRISGRCAYRIHKGGDFEINGPRQVYEGIDFAAGLIMADQRSADYWATVFKQGEEWTGYGNDFIGAVHAEGPNFGPLRRQGACWVSMVARICLWAR